MTYLVGAGLEGSSHTRQTPGNGEGGWETSYREDSEPTKEQREISKIIQRIKHKGSFAGAATLHARRGKGHHKKRREEVFAGGTAETKKC